MHTGQKHIWLWVGSLATNCKIDVVGKKHMPRIHYHKLFLGVSDDSITKQENRKRHGEIWEGIWEFSEWAIIFISD